MDGGSGWKHDYEETSRLAGFLLKADQGGKLLRVENEACEPIWRLIRYQG